MQGNKSYKYLGGGKRMFHVDFNASEFRDVMREELQIIIREEIQAALEVTNFQIQELPPLLTRSQFKELLHIGDTKASELLSREDSQFFVRREYWFLPKCSCNG